MSDKPTKDLRNAAGELVGIARASCAPGTMSDKHKDALDLDRLEALAKKADNIITDLYGDRYIQGSWSRVDLDKEQDDFISALTPVTVINLIALARRASQVSAPAPKLMVDIVTAVMDQFGFLKDANEHQTQELCEALESAIRASEGQAQTSVAGDTDPEMILLDGDEAGMFPGKTIVYTADQMRDYYWMGARNAADADRRAAQLADSTAPGAPTDQERADFEHWYVTHIEGAEIGSADCAARWSTWLARSGGFYKAPIDWRIAPMPWNAPAAPTAQQSLTAGGAVPIMLECVQAVAHNFTSYDRGDDETSCRGCSALVVEGGVINHQPDCIVPRAVAALAAPLPQVQPSEAARDVLAERRRQVEAEGWSTRHDDHHDENDLARAAACYAYPELVAVSGLNAWPWEKGGWKPRDPRRNYVRAAALLLAEIERLDRAADQQPVTPSGALGDSNGGVKS